MRLECLISYLDGFLFDGFAIEVCPRPFCKLTMNTNEHTKKGDKDCHGGLQSYCCVDFKPASSSLKQDLEDAAKAAAEAAAEQAAFDIAAKAIVWSVIRLAVQNLWCRPP